ncbi:MAG: hypothetical protein COV69_00150 [Parcubacteria group bacterium CG11_big_fil_rev_8_21_14_0_20_39_14]|nr:MAG: hypothetical protein COV69_00150 [Parcubacteria group bacterium CG11_big_fil_rev_8_21_14_0_20_39_14]PIS35278.1 MAG: hypothetical protein COT36_03345 [Parcubacteria group bacterium CG08_land_8_20_14_0_20_38_56]
MGLLTNSFIYYNPILRKEKSSLSGLLFLSINYWAISWIFGISEIFLYFPGFKFLHLKIFSQPEEILSQ